MNFFEKVRNSIYSPEFYSKVPKQSFGSALRYFLLLVLLTTVLRSIVPIWDFATVGQKEVDKFVNHVVSVYPAGLEVKIQNGKVSTNQTEPYIIPFPDENNQSENKNLVVIDTKTPFSATQFNQYKTIAWVTQDSIFIKDENKSQFRTIDLSDTDNFTLNKEFVDSIIAKASPWLKVITPVVVVGIIFFIFTSNIFMLVYLLLAAVLIWLMVKIIKRPLSYGGSYKVGIYALTLGFFLETAAEVIHSPGFPFMHTLVTLLVVLFNFLPTQKTVKAKK